MTNTESPSLVSAEDLLDRHGSSPVRPLHLSVVGGVSFSEPVLVEHLRGTAWGVCFTVWLDSGLSELTVPEHTLCRVS